MMAILYIVLFHCKLLQRQRTDSGRVNAVEPPAPPPMPFAGGHTIMVRESCVQTGRVYAIMVRESSVQIGRLYDKLEVQNMDSFHNTNFQRGHPCFIIVIKNFVPY